ncbi:hypothetical protein EJ110_NYTH44389 [Nymphaea thermarum]|nr:hypothetical protein EJ110_NYTH44389 [Nymphaea thermarum]
MHDQIRDMGRKIVEDEEKKGKSCSRLWKNPKVIQALQKQRVPTTATIEGIMYQGEGASDVIVTHLQEIDQLRLFHVYGAKIESSLHFPNNLKWLGLPNCQHLTSPSVSIPAEVRVLDLYGNDNVAKALLENCISTNTVFKKLKILDLTKTGITITPDFSSIPSLLKLTLKYCTKLVEVHESVGKLKSLVWLNLAGCEKLEKLPDTISELTSLEFFSLYGCSDLLYLPKQLGNMTSLKNLDLRTKSKHIKSMSSFIEKLDRLEHLHMDYHIGAGEGDLVAKSKLFLKSAYLLDALPDPCCRSKTYLKLDDITIKELMFSFIRWENLESLILYCTSLKSLPAWVGQLQKLKVLKVLSDKLILADDALPLKTIEKLVLECHVFKHLPPFSKKAQNLKHLALTCTEMEVLPDWIGSSSKLEILELSQCFNTSSFPFVSYIKFSSFS